MRNSLRNIVDDEKYLIGLIDVTKNKMIQQRYSVRQFPIIVTFYNGQRSFDRYHGPLTYSLVLEYIVDQIQNPVKVVSDPNQCPDKLSSPLAFSVIGSFQRFVIYLQFDDECFAYCYVGN